MSKFKNRVRRSRRRGFTLMELMVVIVIIGVLATAGFMTWQWLIGDARYTTASSQISTLKDLVFQYKNRNGELPGGLEDLEEQFGEEIPDDPWGRPYEYEPVDNGFIIWSHGEIEGQDGDDVIYDSEVKRIVIEGEDDGTDN